jgi:D-amino peptidase
MKVYIVTDMEGVSGIVRWEQARVGTPDYYAALPLLVGEINAAVEGAFAGGADEVLVNDGHDGGYNLTYAYRDLDPRATYLTGTPRPQTLCGLDASYDALMMVGYHPMAGTPGGNLAHTQSSKTVACCWLNGTPIGEIGQMAVIAGHYRVPAVFVSGGQAATKEAEALLGQVETAVVKWDQGETSAICLSHTKACEAIRTGAKRAIQLVGHAAPYVVEPPIEVRIACKHTADADAYAARSLRRLDPLTVTTTVDSALDIWRF